MLYALLSTSHHCFWFCCFWGIYRQFVLFGRSWLIYWMVIHCSLMVAHSGFFKEVVFYSFFILLQVLRYTHAARSLSWTPFQWSQSWAEYQPALSNYLQLSLASLLRKIIALHSLSALWFLKSVQHIMPEMFQRIVHILLISFPGVASLWPGYSRAAAVSLGMWHLRVHLLGQHFPQATLACWALWLGIHACGSTV